MCWSFSVDKTTSCFNHLVLSSTVMLSNSDNVLNDMVVFLYTFRCGTFSSSFYNF